MKAVLLAGGRGTRLQPLTNYVAKPLVPVAGRPCIEYLVSSMIDADVDDVIFTSCFRSDYLMNALGGGDRFGAIFMYGVEDEPAGTAGGVKRILPFLDKTSLIANGDLMVDVDIGKIIDFHNSHNGAVTIALHEVPDPSEFGVVDLGEGGQIMRFQEKPKREDAFSNLINAGIYVIDDFVLELIPDGKKFDFARHLFPLCLEKGIPLFGIELSGDWIDVGRPLDLLEATHRMVKKYGVKKEWGHLKIDPNLDHSVPEEVVLDGCVYLGPEVLVGDSCTVRDSSLEKGARLGEGSVLENTVLMPGSHVGKKCHLADCIVCPGKEVADGTTVRGKILD